MKKVTVFRLHILQRAVDLCGQELILPFGRFMHTGERMMKKLLVLGSLLVLATGCGHGSMPNIFRGSSCNGLCSATTPSLPSGCDNCTSSGYESYGSEGFVGGDAVSVPPMSPTFVTPGAPSMAPLPSGGTLVQPK